MRHTPPILAAALVLLAIAAGAADSTSVIAPGAKVEKLADGFSFTEGPTADQEGNVYFTDQPNDRILRWGTDGKLTTFLQPSGRSNGMYFDPRGNLISCADQDNQLWSIDSSGKATVLVKDYEGRLLNGPNDVWLHPGGAIYFTDPLYKRPYWKRGPMEQDGQHVYRLSPDGSKLVRVVEDMKQPNGITGTPDGQKLYVADIGSSRTWSYDIAADGSLSGKRLFCESGSDGMTIDEEGNIYLTGKGVLVFDKTGRQIETIPVPEPWSANVSFGGPDHRTLFITASKGFYSVRLRLRGANPAK